MAPMFNDSLGKLVPSGIRRFSTLAQQTPRCISLTLGEPGEDTPAPVRRWVGVDLEKGLTHYPPNNGYASLREAIAAHERACGVGVSADEVMVTAGATEALFVALCTMLNPGDEVVVPTPAFSLYESITTLLGGRCVRLDTTAEDFQIAADALEAVVTERTKALVITSPNNPTGCVLNERSLEAVAACAVRHDLFVVCDDVYEQLVFVPGFRRFAAGHPELRDRVVVANSFSKPWAMTGWRMGWLAAHETFVAEASKVHQYMVSSIPAFVQHAGIEALSSDVGDMRERYRRRRDATMRALAAMGLPTVRPEGAFYAFPHIGELGLSSETFCERAIREAGVALVPGVFFGAEGYVRLSYACSDADLDEGLARLEGFVATLR